MIILVAAYHILFLHFSAPIDFTKSKLLQSIFITSESRICKLGFFPWAAQKPLAPS
jgi:hypothetical protein